MEVFEVTCFVLLLYLQFHLGYGMHSITDCTKFQLLNYIQACTEFSTSFIIASQTSSSLLTPKETIATTISNVPGYGQPDVFYPAYFEGDWIVHQNFTIQDSSDFDKSTLWLLLPKYSSVSYVRRYTKYNNHVVLDRSYSETQCFRACTDDKNAYAAWDITNPNIIQVFTSDRKVQDKRVTKRAIDNNPDSANFGYSEFSQITLSNSGTFSVPKVYGCRQRAIFRSYVDSKANSQSIGNLNSVEGPLSTNYNSDQISHNFPKVRSIESLERSTFFPSLSESQYSKDEKPMLILKSSLLLTRF